MPLSALSGSRLSWGKRRGTRGIFVFGGAFSVRRAGRAFFFFVFSCLVLFFFVSLFLVFSSFPWLLLRFPRPLPWCRHSASPPCSVGSPCASSACRPRPAFPSRSGSPQRVPGSPRGCVVGLGVPGRLAGRWLACAHPGLGCRCCRAGSPPLACSSFCFLNFFLQLFGAGGSDAACFEGKKNRFFLKKSC